VVPLGYIREAIDWAPPKLDICCGAFPLETSSQSAADGFEHIPHMQKSLSQMNLQIHNVPSDLTRASGQAILDAILAGEP